MRHRRSGSELHLQASECRRMRCHGMHGVACEPGVTRQGRRLQKEQEPRPTGTSVILRNLDLVVSHGQSMCMEQQEMQGHR